MISGGAHCGRCGKEWGGMRTAHCAACHVTFTGLTAFDAHRKGGKCAQPEDAGLVEAGRAYSCFGAPADPETAEWWADRAS
jgi:hypothetical protein